MENEHNNTLSLPNDLGNDSTNAINSNERDKDKDSFNDDEGLISPKAPTWMGTGGYSIGSIVWVKQMKDELSHGSMKPAPIVQYDGWVKAEIIDVKVQEKNWYIFTVNELLGNDNYGYGANEDYLNSIDRVEFRNGNTSRIIRTERSLEGDFPDLKLANFSSEENQDMLGGKSAEDCANNVDDLIQLTHLHEPAILYTLELRYWQNIIYTYTGPILLAINPFKGLPLLLLTILP